MVEVVELISAVVATIAYEKNGDPKHVSPQGGRGPDRIAPGLQIA